MTVDAHRLSHLYEVAALERPLVPAERAEAGLEVVAVDHAHVIDLWERAALERPLTAEERFELELDLVAA